jgi:hypothetical protein
VHQVEHITKASAIIDRRPLVQLGLHPLYPRPGLFQPGPRGQDIHPGIFSHCSPSLLISLPPFAM